MKHRGRDPAISSLMSPPTRGAWIETVSVPGVKGLEGVAPHAGGVD